VAHVGVPTSHSIHKKNAASGVVEKLAAADTVVTLNGAVGTLFSDVIVSLGAKEAWRTRDLYPIYYQLSNLFGTTAEEKRTELSNAGWLPGGEHV